MALVAFGGFEADSNVSRFPELAMGKSGSIATSPVRTGEGSGRCNPSASTQEFRFGQPSDSTGAAGNIPSTAWAGCWVRFATLPSAATDIVRLCNSLGSPVVSLKVDNTGAVTLVGTSTSATITTVTTGQWYLFEIRGSSGGTCGGRVDLGPETTVTGNAVTVQRLGLGQPSGATMDCYFDDWYIDDAAYQGVGECHMLLPNGAGNYSAWTSGTGSTYTEIDDYTSNGGHDTDTTYIARTGATGASTFTLTDTTQGGTLGSIVGTIGGVLAQAICRDTGGTSALRIRIRDGSTDSDTSADNNIGNTYSDYYKFRATAPSSGSAWTLSQIDSLEVGVVANNTAALRCTALCALVWTTGYNWAPNQGNLTRPPADFPPPRGPARPILDFAPNTIALLSEPVVVVNPEMRNYDWPPAPRGYPYPVALRTWLPANDALALVGQDRFYGDPGQGIAYDWQLPPKGRAPGIDLKTWLLNGTGYIGLDRVYADPGQVPTYDWQLPPKGRAPGISLKTTLHPNQPATLIGFDAVYGAPGEAPAYDWQLPPRGYPYPSALRGWLPANESNFLIGQDQFYGDPGQAIAFDWQLPPKGRPYPVVLRGWLHPDLPTMLIGLDAFYGAPGEVPARDLQLPPRGPESHRSNRTWLLSGTSYIGQDAIFGAPGQAPAYDWQLPPRGAAPRGPDLRSWLQQGLALYVVEAMPFLMPLLALPPNGRAFPIALRTWILRGTGMIGQDSVYEAPGQAPVYDWPVPKGPARASTLREWTQRTSLAGQDRIYGQPGQAPTYDWQLPPKGRLPSIDLKTFLRSGVRYIGSDRVYGGPGQVPTYDWQLPPRGRVPGIALRSITHDGIAFAFGLVPAAVRLAGGTTFYVLVPSAVAEAIEQQGASVEYADVASAVVEAPGRVAGGITRPGAVSVPVHFGDEDFGDGTFGATPPAIYLGGGFLR